MGRHRNGTKDNTMEILGNEVSLGLAGLESVVEAI